jgi:hypothetical protein
MEKKVNVMLKKNEGYFWDDVFDFFSEERHEEFFEVAKKEVSHI